MSAGGMTDMLVNMGFDRVAAEAAMKETQSLEEAVEWLTKSETMKNDALRLATEAPGAADELLTVLTAISANHSDSRYRILPYTGRGRFQDALRSPGGEAVMRFAGFRPESGMFALKKFSPNVDAAREALASAVASKKGSEASAQRRANESGIIEAAKTRRTVAKSFQSQQEPVGGATITFVLPGNHRVPRRFDGDDCFEKLIRFLATVDSSKTPPDFLEGKTWRILVDRLGAPVWWCDAWTFATDDLTFEPKHASSTLNALGLWPSATIRVTSASAANVMPPPPPPAVPVTSSSSGGGYRLGGGPSKPKPSDLFQKVETRFQNAPSRGRDDRKQHFNVAKSVDKVPGLAELLGMGFSETKARAALKRYNGNLQEALDALLSSSS